MHDHLVGREIRFAGVSITTSELHSGRTTTVSYPYANVETHVVDYFVGDTDKLLEYYRNVGNLNARFERYIELNSHGFR